MAEPLLSLSQIANETANFQLNPLDIQKMIFIYNAVIAGWTVKMIDNNKFEFKQSKSKIKQEVHLENYLKTFISNNMANISNISNVNNSVNNSINNSVNTSVDNSANDSLNNSNTANTI